MEHIKIIYPAFDIVLQWFSLTQADFERMSVEALAEIEVEG